MNRMAASMEALRFRVVTRLASPDPASKCGPLRALAFVPVSGVSRYTEGTLFLWTMSDFSLMDAIECGIVKLPRVPVAENIPGDEMPMYRNLWDHIRSKMPKKGRGNAGALSPLTAAGPVCDRHNGGWVQYPKRLRAGRGDSSNVEESKREIARDGEGMAKAILSATCPNCFQRTGSNVRTVGRRRGFRGTSVNTRNEAACE
jgi:hypothetical protein